MSTTMIVPTSATAPGISAPTRRRATIERATSRATSRATGDLPAYVTGDQVQAMAAAAPSTRDRLLILTLWYSGGRVSEVVALRRDQIDEAGGCVRLDNLKRKGRRPGAPPPAKTVYLPRDLLAALRQYATDARLTHAGHLFQSRQSLRPGEALAEPSADAATRSKRTAHLSRYAAWRIVQTAAAKAGVVVTDTRRRARATDTPADAATTTRPPTPLDFRHGIAVWLLQNGAPITDVASHLGHATVETTMIYLRTSDAHKRATFDRLWAGTAP
jgi:integrase